MRTIGIGVLVIAATVAGCTASSSSPEQAMAPAAGAEPLSYPAQNMTEFDAAMNQADDWCYKQNDLRRAKYVDRTFETARFECAPR
jgi:hypothetical protein